MKKWIILTAAITFAVGLVVGSAYVALAQGNTPPTPFGGPGGWMGRGMMGNYGQTFTGTVPFGQGGMMRGRGYGQRYRQLRQCGEVPEQSHRCSRTARCERGGSSYGFSSER